MKNVLFALPLLGVVLFFQAESAIAGSCRPLEYAELKDMQSEKLIKTYCLYGKLAKIDQKAALGFINLGVGDHGYEASRDECYDQQSKISNILQSRSESAEPSCEEK